MNSAQTVISVGERVVELGNIAAEDSPNPAERYPTVSPLNNEIADLDVLAGVEQRYAIPVRERLLHGIHSGVLFVINTSHEMLSRVASFVKPSEANTMNTPPAEVGPRRRGEIKIVPAS